MKKDILFLTNVHGDEPDATGILSKLKTQNKLNCDWIIANPKARKINKRFIDVDMNRNAPGSLKSKYYECRRLVSILKKAKKYKVVIDLHGSKGNQGSFIIMPKINLENIVLASLLPLPRILIWPFNPNIKRGPIMKFLDCGLGIEFGPKQTPKIKKLVKETILEILKGGLVFNLKNIQKKNFI